MTADADAAPLGRIEDGDLDVAILLPADIASRVGRRSPSSPTASIRPGRRPSSRVVSQAILSAAGGVGAGPAPDDRRTRPSTAPSSSDPIASFAPAIVGFFVYFFVYILTGVSFLRERTGGTLERLMATPVTQGEVVAGYTIGFCVFATIQVAILMTWALGTRPRAGHRAAARVRRSASGSRSPAARSSPSSSCSPSRSGR